jgi:hypothetical protein
VQLLPNTKLSKINQHIAAGLFPEGPSPAALSLAASPRRFRSAEGMPDGSCSQIAGFQRLGELSTLWMSVDVVNPRFRSFFAVAESTLHNSVEMTGIEPVTSWLQTTRSPS